MITFHQGDILQFVDDLTHDITDCRLFLAHCVNNKGIMGSGVAKAIYTKYPLVKDMYHWYDQKYGLTLGSFHVVQLKQNLFVANVVGQDGILSETNLKPIVYASLESGLLNLRRTLHPSDVVAVPLIGCGLAGGEFHIVYDILNRVFDDVECTVCYLEKDSKIVKDYIS